MVSPPPCFLRVRLGGLATLFFTTASLSLPLYLTGSYRSTLAYRMNTAARRLSPRCLRVSVPQLFLCFPTISWPCADTNHVNPNFEASPWLGCGGGGQKQKDLWFWSQSAASTFFFFFLSVFICCSCDSHGRT